MTDMLPFRILSPVCHQNSHHGKAVGVVVVVLPANKPRVVSTVTKNGSSL
jgi:hypothetical protein